MRAVGGGCDPALGSKRARAIAEFIVTRGIKCSSDYGRRCELRASSSVISMTLTFASPDIIIP